MKKLNLEGLERISKRALTRNQQREVMGGYGPWGGPCLPRWTGCNTVTENTDCCGSGKCMMYNGHEQCV